MIITEPLLKKLSNTPGVNEHRGRLRGHFRLPGDNKYTKKSFGLSATITNITIAKNKLGAINIDISNGAYDLDPKAFWRKHFPNDVMNAQGKVTLLDYFKSYRAAREHELSYSMMCKLTTCQNWVESYGLLHKDISEIDHNILNELRRSSLETRVASTVKEYSIALRQVLWQAIADEIIEFDPFLKVLKLTEDDNVEDECVLPFSNTELKALLNVIHVPQTKLMVELLAWTGLRPGELKALAWEDVNLTDGYISVKYNIDREGKLKPPKTKASKRKIELLPRTIELLNNIKETTFDVSPKLEIVHYKNYKTKTVLRRRVVLNHGKPYIRPELAPAPKQWRNWLKKAKLPYRPTYQLRHTYASRMLTADAHPAWLAQQMGHKDWGMIRTIYAQWIPQNNPDHVKGIAKKLGQSYR
ncbi:MAG: integrase [Psychroserpens sp.]|jgi:integrase